jgi:hypothetical protein
MYDGYRMQIWVPAVRTTLLIRAARRKRSPPRPIDELKASLIAVPEASDEWFQIKTGIRERDIARLVLMEKKRCDDVVKEYFEENPHLLSRNPHYVGENRAEIMVIDHNRDIVGPCSYQANNNAELQMLRIPRMVWSFFDIDSDDDSAENGRDWGVYPYFTFRRALFSSVQHQKASMCVASIFEMYCVCDCHRTDVGLFCLSAMPASGSLSARNAYPKKAKCSTLAFFAEPWRHQLMRHFQ